MKFRVTDRHTGTVQRYETLNEALNFIWKQPAIHRYYWEKDETQMAMKDETDTRAMLGAILGELELINGMRRKNSRRYDILISRAQALAWVVGDRANLDAVPSVADYSRATRSRLTLEEHRDNLRNTHPELFDVSTCAELHPETAS